MPRLEEVECYLRGLWLLLIGRSEGFGWLDFSERGFWRSWWAIVYCLPPIFLNWAGSRIYYLSTMPEGTVAGPAFIAKLAALDASVWITSYLALAVVMSLSGYRSRVSAVVIAINWLTVPVQWTIIPLSLVQIFAPSNADLFVSTGLPLLILSLLVHFMIVRRFVDGKALPASAFLLTMMVASLWTSYSVGDLLGVTGS